MKTYLELLVPIRNDAKWFKDLRTVFRDKNVKWQHGHYHITMAFCDETPDVDLCPILEKHLGSSVSPMLTFDHLNAFATRSGTYVVHLGVTNIPDSFNSLVDAIRKDLSNAGCKILSDFKLHVTLGRIADKAIGLATVQKLIKSIPQPRFTLKLSKYVFREYENYNDDGVIYQKEII